MKAVCVSRKNVEGDFERHVNYIARGGKEQKGGKESSSPGLLFRRDQSRIEEAASKGRELRVKRDQRSIALTFRRGGSTVICSRAPRRRGLDSIRDPPHRGGKGAKVDRSNTY